MYGENHVPRHQWHDSLWFSKTHTSYEFVKLDGAMMVPHGVTPKRVVCKSALAPFLLFFVDHVTVWSSGPSSQTIVHCANEILRSLQDRSGCHSRHCQCLETDPTVGCLVGCLILNELFRPDRYLVELDPTSCTTPEIMPLQIIPPSTAKPEL